MSADVGAPDPGRVSAREILASERAAAKIRTERTLLRQAQSQSGLQDARLQVQDVRLQLAHLVSALKNRPLQTDHGHGQSEQNSVDVIAQLTTAIESLDQLGKQLHNRIDNGSHNALRRQVGLDLGDQTQKPVEEDSVPNFRVRSAQSEALERLCAHGLLRKADVSEVHPDLLTLHGRLTRYVAGAVLTPFRWLQRSGWLRQAPGRRGPSGATTGGAR